MSGERAAGRISIANTKFKFQYKKFVVDTNYSIIRDERNSIMPLAQVLLSEEKEHESLFKISFRDHVRERHVYTLL
jgi:hypothetical protein